MIIKKCLCEGYITRDDNGEIAKCLLNVTL
jgi:hypothetical protein